MKEIIHQKTEKADNIVCALVKFAFEGMAYAGGDEPDLVYRPRKSDAFIPQLSFEASGDNEIVSNIRFTKKAGGTPA